MRTKNFSLAFQKDDSPAVAKKRVMDALKIIESGNYRVLGVEIKIAGTATAKKVPVKRRTKPLVVKEIGSGIGEGGGE